MTKEVNTISASNFARGAPKQKCGALQEHFSKIFQSTCEAKS
ncbi:hypothetical protein B4144_3610 [Bacillus atrophaeus]|nr:hypothetical protein B4144_3610 [Bacillus atrophaeus]